MYVCVSSPHQPSAQCVFHSWHYNKLCDQFPWFPLTVSRYRRLAEVNRGGACWCAATGEAGGRSVSELETGEMDLCTGRASDAAIGDGEITAPAADREAADFPATVFHTATFFAIA